MGNDVLEHAAADQPPKLLSTPVPQPSSPTHGAVSHPLALLAFGLDSPLKTPALVVGWDSVLIFSLLV